MTMPSFILPPNGKATPESIKRKRRMAESLMQSGMQTGPIGHWTQGMARIAQAVVGGMSSRRADEQDFALQDADKKEKMARLLKEDQWKLDERNHQWGMDAFNRARMTGQDAMQKTTFQNQLEDRQTEQDRLAAQQGVYEGQINQTNTHPGNMQGPQQPSYSPEQFGQAQMYAAGGDYGKAGELLNPIEDPSKPTSDMIEYDAAINQGFRGSLQDWIVQNKKAGATNVTVNGDGSVADGELRKKLQGKEGELWAEVKTTAITSAGMAQDMQVIDELIGMAPQGPVVGRLAEWFPGVSSAGAAFDSIVKRLAPTLRVPGSGATSDIEYEGMLRGYPALRNRPEANALISQIMKSKAQLNIERGEIVDAYSNGEIDANTARQRMSELDHRSILTPQMRQLLAGVDPGAGAPDIEQRLQRYK